MSAGMNLLNAIGWSLLDSIWQMGLLWLTYYMLTVQNKRYSAAGRHNLILLFVFFGTEWFVYTFIRVLNEGSISVFRGFISIPAAADQWIPYLALIYLFLLSFRFLQFGVEFYGSRKSIPSLQRTVELQFLVERHARLMGITRRVTVYISDLIETAETRRFFKPLILLPVSLLTRLSPQHVEAILVHELLHIRRNDFLINICMSLFRNIFFFNPFARILYRELAIERELACDDGVVEKGYTPEIYAEALFNLEKLRNARPGFSMAADGNRPWLLMDRIQRLLGKDTVRKKPVNPMIFFLLAVAFALSGLHRQADLKSPKPIQNPGYFAGAGLRDDEITAKTKLAPFTMEVRPPVQQKPTEHNKESVEKFHPAEVVLHQKVKPTEPVNTYFAESKTAVDFSNQQTSGIVRDQVLAFPGTPYVPSNSLSYEALPEILAADSIVEIHFQNGINEVISLTRIKAIARLKELESEIEKNKLHLKEEESKNRNLILSDHREMKSILENVHHLLESREKQINLLLNTLQDTEEEIIHI
jgi:beta-lactamase regulating signal transducer with metallopeptidase domain